MAGSTVLGIRSRTVTGGVVVLSVAGEIDLATADEFHDGLSPHLSDPATTLLVCDLSQVRFLACSGLTILVDAHSALAARGARLSVVANHPAVLRPVTATGLDELLRLRPNLSTALSESFVD